MSFSRDVLKNIDFYFLFIFIINISKEFPLFFCGILHELFGFGVLFSLLHDVPIEIVGNRLVEPDNVVHHVILLYSV